MATAAPTQEETTHRVDPEPPLAGVPNGVVRVLAWSAAVLTFIAAARLVLDILGQFTVVLIPLGVALLLTALLSPLVNAAQTHLHLHRGLASVILLVSVILSVAGAIALMATEIVAQASDLSVTLTRAVSGITEWLQTGPLQLSASQLSGYVDQLSGWVNGHVDAFGNSALSLGTSAVDLMAGTIICLIATFFFLLEGRDIWLFLLRILARGNAERLYQASRRGWVSMSAYARMQVIIAIVDACGIGLGAYLLGLPFVVPLTIVVFFACFVPIIGAFIAGLLPTLVALAASGPTTALVMLGIVLAVQQTESHLLQPFLMGRAVAIHPLAVIVSVTAGTYIFGLAGALFAVPVLAACNSTVRYLSGADPFPELASSPGENDNDRV